MAKTERAPRLVWVYPDGGREPIGKRRFEVEWQELTASAKKRHKLPDYDHDRDRDEVSVVRHFDTKEAARAFARKTVDAYKTVYGSATVEEQVLEVSDLRDGVGEWAEVGEVEYVD